MCGLNWECNLGKGTYVVPYFVIELQNRSSTEQPDRIYDIFQYIKPGHFEFVGCIDLDFVRYGG